VLATVFDYGSTVVFWLVWIVPVFIVSSVLNFLKRKQLAENVIPPEQRTSTQGYAAVALLKLCCLIELVALIELVDCIELVTFWLIVLVALGWLI
jgi:hypothetical protein